MQFEREPEEYARDFAKGHQTEQNFIDLIADMGGSAFKIGHLPKLGFPQPRMAVPSRDGDGYNFIIAPDAVFVFPDQPVMLAQIKSKQLEGKVEDGSAFFYLDERELYLMRRAAEHYTHVILAIECPAFRQAAGHQFIWLHVAELAPSRIELLKRRVLGKPTFLLPLHLFKPITELKDIAHVEPLPRKHHRSRKANYRRQPRSERRQQIPRRAGTGAASGHTLAKMSALLPMK